MEKQRRYLTLIKLISDERGLDPVKITGAIEADPLGTFGGKW